MNYNAKGYSAIQEGKARREAYILRRIEQDGFYGTYTTWTNAGYNAFDRLAKRGVIIYDKTKGGYIMAKKEA